MRACKCTAANLALICILAYSCYGVSVTSAAEPTTSASKFEGLGNGGRKVSTKSAEAQRYFDEGLAFLYAFNHDEAIRSFTKAAELDPQCAMAWWGIALAHGPHINNPVVTPEHAQAAWAALTKAQAAAKSATPVEQALIKALTARYANPQPEDRAPLDQAYADAMRKVWKAYPSDPDVGALFAESLMDLRPWDQWTVDGEPQPGTAEVVDTLEAVITRAPNHPLALHLYIHAVEASPHPEWADAPADRLRTLQPGLGHLVHMPSHVDVRRGRWKQAIDTNTKAIEADSKYREKSPDQGFYRIYMAHNYHMLAYAAIMRGQSKLAIDAIDAMVREMPKEWVESNAELADGFVAMPLEMLVRFGRWDQVIAAPEPPEYLPVSRALRHCARGIAYAAKGEVSLAKKEQQAFLKAKAAVREEARVGNNAAQDVLGVAEHLLAGEILNRSGDTTAALAELREAVKREDALRYSEPPDWIHPVRHALGAALLQFDRPAEAEQVYRDDLAKLPENGWALYGLARSLKLQGKDDKTAMAAFENAWRDADVKITSSCFCQPGK